jgi:CheY-like chemotaxis protein
VLPSSQAGWRPETNALLKALAEHAQEPQGEPASGGSKPARSSLRILLAEDNAVNQKVALRLLDQLGYRADVVSNGLEALDALERQPYDVVLMDVQMPELDGLGAARQICERWSADERPRVIAMTANAMPEDRETCFAAGMDDYVPKPIRPDELTQALGRARVIAGTPEASVNGAGASLGPGQSTASKSSVARSSSPRSSTRSSTTPLRSWPRSGRRASAATRRSCAARLTRSNPMVRPSEQSSSPNSAATSRTGRSELSSTACPSSSIGSTMRTEP